MRTRRILPRSVPQSTDSLWEVAAQIAFTSFRFQSSHRTIVLRAIGGQDSHRDTDPRHVAQWQFVHVVHALRTPAVIFVPSHQEQLAK